MNNAEIPTTLLADGAPTNVNVIASAQLVGSFDPFPSPLDPHPPAAQDFVSNMDCVTMETIAMTPEQLNSNTSTPTPTSPVTNGNDTLSSTLTLRMIMQGKVGQKEAGSIIGKKGDNVKKFREDSGAKINISDASCPERIVTVTGTTDQIYKAFTMICRKFEEDIQVTHQGSSLPRPPVTIRLIVPASQCGSLIGKGGSKIKEIRESTGASIQVASEMLPNSTERAVTVTGSADSITKCIYHICTVMLESPPKGATIPYRPKPSLPPVLFAGAQPYAVPQGQYTLAAQQGDPRGAMVQISTGNPAAMSQHPQVMIQKGHQAPPQHKVANIAGVQPGLLGHPMPMVGAHPFMAAGIPAGGVALPTSMYARPHLNPQHGAASPHQQAHEMTIPNDLIGCIIGRGGSKINEIRQLSGATIKIANVEEGSADRKVTITGTPDTINAAQYLINASIEMHKQQLAMDPSLAAGVATSGAMTTLASAAPQPMAPHQALAFGPAGGALLKPMPLLAPHHMQGAAGLSFIPAPQNAMTTKIKGPAPTLISTAPSAAAAAAAAAAAFKKNGNKFSPY